MCGCVTCLFLLSLASIIPDICQRKICSTILAKLSKLFIKILNTDKMEFGQGHSCKLSSWVTPNMCWQGLYGQNSYFPMRLCCYFWRTTTPRIPGGFLDIRQVGLTGFLGSNIYSWKNPCVHIVVIWLSCVLIYLVYFVPVSPSCSALQGQICVFCLHI